MRIVFNCFILFCAIVSFSRGHCQQISHEPKYVMYADEIVKAFEREMEENFGLSCCGGGGSMPYNVKEIEVLFEVPHKATVEEARYLEVEATQRLLKKINSHEKIRPYLNVFPFTESDVSISIHFIDVDKGFYANELSDVSMYSGIIEYSGIEEATDKSYTFKREAYEDAVALLQANKDGHPNLNALWFKKNRSVCE